jgi:S-adenosylmethionine hydrolase
LSAGPSATFHGRDIFAPAAALVARGRGKRITGSPVTPVVLKQAFSQRGADGAALGWIVHLDRFGNAVTSIRGTEVPENKEVQVEFMARGQVVREPYRVRLPGIRRTFADVPKGQPLAYVGSLGFLEIGVRNGNAADKFKLKPGIPVRVGKSPSSI